jgi:GxxExxY protein
MQLGNTKLTERIIGAAIRVHKEIGPGFLESLYEEAMAIEFAEANIFFERQKLLPVFYREHIIGEHRLDFLVDHKVIVELKAISELQDVHFRDSSLLFEGLEPSGCVAAKFCYDSPYDQTCWSGVRSQIRK